MDLTWTQLAFRTFPYGMGALDLGLALIYASRREYRLALTWTAYAVAAVALGGVRNTQ